jgi:hypothetical protein
MQQSKMKKRRRERLLIFDKAKEKNVRFSRKKNAKMRKEPTEDSADSFYLLTH